MKLSDLEKMCDDYIANPKSPHDDPFTGFARYESIIIARKLKAILQYAESEKQVEIPDLIKILESDDGVGE